jgi:hypothetical protein
MLFSLRSYLFFYRAEKWTVNLICNDPPERTFVIAQVRKHIAIMPQVAAGVITVLVKQTNEEVLA